MITKIVLRRHLGILAALAAAWSAATSHAQDAQARFDQMRRAAQYAEAEKIALAEKAHFEQNDSREMATIATWARNLGNLYLDQGRYAEAEPQFKQALAVAQEHAAF